MERIVLLMIWLAGLAGWSVRTAFADPVRPPAGQQEPAGLSREDVAREGPENAGVFPPDDGPPVIRRGMVAALHRPQAAGGAAIRVEGPLIVQDPELEIGHPMMIRVQPAILLNDVLSRGQQPDTDDSDFHLGANLKTDADLESVLEKAARYELDGNWDVATQLWQAVLEQSGDTLVSSDGRLYRSMAEQVMETLCRLPEEGLAVYRIKADAAARAILAEAGDPWDIEALGRVVDRYFPSSIGDDAALRLATLLMDQHEFVGAQRLLERVLEWHPDRDMDRGRIALQLAMCRAWLGDTAASAAILGQYPDAADSAMGRELAARLGEGTSFSQWRESATGAFEDFRTQPALPEGYFDGPLVAAWQFGLDPDPNYRPEDAAGRIIRAPADAGEGFAGENLKTAERNLHRQWREQTWRPAGSLVARDGMVWFRSAANVSCWETGDLSAPAWRSAWINRFELDAASATMEVYRRQWASNRFPSTSISRGKLPESEQSIQFFGDRIHASMRLAGETLYVIEGRTIEGRESPQRNQQGIAWNSRTPRTRSNYLAAYEAATGRALWKIPRERGKWNPAPAAVGPAPPAAGDGGGSHADGGFMGPPEVVGNRLYVPTSSGGAIHVSCLDADDPGRTIWRTWLCDEPESGAHPWSPIVITTEGNDLFAGTGMGVVFCLDRTTGSVRYACRYPRAGTPNFALRNFGMMMNSLTFDGWTEDLLIPWGRQLICLASDAGSIFAIDRGTGALIWQSDLQPLGVRLDYLLGIHDRILYAAGWETIVAFDLDGQGRMLWGGGPLFGGERSFGAGVLTPGGIAVPVGTEVWLFALRPRDSMPQPLARCPVNLGSTAPVGNLASDGRCLWVHGGNRFLKLVPEKGRTGDDISQSQWPGPPALPVSSPAPPGEGGTP